jgi:hypothetical protein
VCLFLSFLYPLLKCLCSLNISVIYFFSVVQLFTSAERVGVIRLADRKLNSIKTETDGSSILIIHMWKSNFVKAELVTNMCVPCFG